MMDGDESEPYRQLELNELWVFETVAGEYKQELEKGVPKGGDSIFGEDPTISQFGLPQLPSELFAFNEGSNLKMFSPMSFPHNAKNMAYNEQRAKLKQKLSQERQVRNHLKGII